MRTPTRLSLLLATSLAASVVAPAAAVAEPTYPYTLTILHSNDGESNLLPDGEIGGVARFATLVADEQAAGDTGVDSGVVTISSGDNYLAGPQFAASLDLPDGEPFYDTIALDAMGYDASAIGNHEFDFGPEVLADFLAGFGDDGPTFVSANLGFDGTALEPFVVDGTIVSSYVEDRDDGFGIGIVGATTPLLASISSPQDVTVDPAVAAAVQAEIDAFADTVDVVVLTSHLQSSSEDQELLSMLSGVDIAIAGGGDELLADAGTPLLPSDVEEGPVGDYPLTGTDADDNDVPIVTTSGSYGYLGRLVVEVAMDGTVTVDEAASGPIANPDEGVEGAGPVRTPDPTVQAEVEEPVAAYQQDLAENVIATSEVALNGVRGDVRTVETNLGNLLADALLDTGVENAASIGVGEPDIAIQNGGGMRNDAVIEAGELTELDTFEVAPFSNFVSVTEDVPADVVKLLFENAVSNVENVDGRFAQVAGMQLVYDPAGTPLDIDDATGEVVQEGSRVRTITLDDGTVLVENGEVVDGAPAIGIATNDFTARGGDEYPFGEYADDLVSTGVSYQQALQSYIVDDLGGTVTAADYPEGGTGRVTTIERLAGINRYETAVEVSQTDYPDGAVRAYIARGDLFPDSVAGGPVAYAGDGPILLSATDDLTDVTAAELERLGVEEIVVLGRTNAISETVESQLAEIAPTTRLGGADRFETAAVASAETFEPGVDVAYVATGREFPDALTGGVAASLDAAPVLLVEVDEIPASTAAELERLAPGRIVLVGGTNAVDAEVEAALAGYTDGGVERLAGVDRFETAAAVAATIEDATTAVVATGRNFADALVGVPFAANGTAPILLSEVTGFPDVSLEVFTAIAPDAATILGGTAAVPADTEAAMRDVIRMPDTDTEG